MDSTTPEPGAAAGPGRLGAFARSSIGKKALMSLTGLALVGYLIVHLAGNLTLFADDTGATFDSYAKKLEDNPFLLFAEVGLALLFVAHIALALRTSLENREARAQRYAVRSSLGKRTFASSSMLLTGVVVLVFLVIHVWDFRVGERAPDGLAAMVVRRLSAPLGAGIYLAGVLALGVHLFHATRSALQSLGLNHPRYNLWMARGGQALALILFAGFAAFPVVLFASSRPTSTASAAGPSPSSASPVALDGLESSRTQAPESPEPARAPSTSQERQ